MIHCEIPRGLRKSYKKMVYNHFLSELKANFTKNVRPRFKVGDVISLPKEKRTFRGGWDGWHPDLYTRPNPLPVKASVKSLIVQDSQIHEKIFYGAGSQALDEITTTWNLHQEMINLTAVSNGLYWAIYLNELPEHGNFAEELFY
jgi:hypothetical protein